jgi:hypothetical protein
MCMGFQTYFMARHARITVHFNSIVMVEWLALLLRIREISGSNLRSLQVQISGQRPAILTAGFRVFLSPSSQDSSLKLGHNHFLLILSNS